MIYDIGDDTSIIVEMTHTIIQIIYSEILFFILIIKEEPLNFFFTTGEKKPIINMGE